MVVRLILLQHNAFQGDKKSVISLAHFGTVALLCKAGVQLTCIHRRCHHSSLVTLRQGGGPPSLSLQGEQDRHFSTIVKEQHFHPWM